jgi:hypothetical protein
VLMQRKRKRRSIQKLLQNDRPFFEEPTYLVCTNV